MNAKNRFVVIAGSALVAAGLLAGAAFAAGTGTTLTVPSMADRIDQAVTAGRLSQAEADVLKQVDSLRVSTMTKLHEDIQAVIDQAVADGKITQEQADKLQPYGGSRGMGMGPGAFNQDGTCLLTDEEQKARLDEAVAAGRLTQEQADAILNGETPMGPMGGGMGGMGGRMGGGMHGGMGGGMRGFMNQQPSGNTN